MFVSIDNRQRKISMVGRSGSFPCNSIPGHSYYMHFGGWMWRTPNSNKYKRGEFTMNIKTRSFEINDLLQKIYNDLKLSPSELAIALSTSENTLNQTSLTDTACMNIANIAFIHETDNDTRLRSYIQELILHYNFSYALISKLTDLPSEKIESFIKDPSSLCIDERYQLAIKSSFIIILLLQATK